MKEFPVLEFRGLNNLGSTCYLNTLLQALFMTEDFNKEVCNYESTAEDRTKDIVWQLKGLFEQLKQKNLTAADPTGVVQCLGIKDVWKQNDLGEYFRLLMNQIATTVPEKLVFLELFRTTQVHILKCIQCELKEDKQTGEEEERTPVLEIPVPLMSSNNKPFETLDKALEEIFRSEILTNDNQLYCDSCDQKSDTELQYYFETLPNILVLQLKRCGLSLHFHISIPSSLCFTKAASEKERWHLLSEAEKSKGEPDDKKKITKYELFVICRRVGGSKSGHYFADIKKNSQWYCFNDACVTKIDSPSDVTEDIQEKGSLWNLFNINKWKTYLTNSSPPAYLLMYRNKDKPRNKVNFEQRPKKTDRKRPRSNSHLYEQQNLLKRPKIDEIEHLKSTAEDSKRTPGEAKQIICKGTDKEKQKPTGERTNSEMHRTSQHSETAESHSRITERKSCAEMRTTSLDRHMPHERRKQHSELQRNYFHTEKRRSQDKRRATSQYCKSPHEGIEQKKHLERNYDHIFNEQRNLIADVRNMSLDQGRWHDRLEQPIVTAVDEEKTKNKQTDTASSGPNSSPTEHRTDNVELCLVTCMDEDLEVANGQTNMCTKLTCMCSLLCWKKTKNERKEEKQQNETVY